MEEDFDSVAARIEGLEKAVEGLTATNSANEPILYGFTIPELIGIALTIVLAIIALLSYRQQRMAAIDTNFDVLQRLNEKALESPENLKAAFQSVQPGKPYNDAAAREIFFHYLRLNRLYRAWLFRKSFLITWPEYRRIMKNYAGTLIQAMDDDLLDAMGDRGYSPKFIRDLKKFIVTSKTPREIPLKGRTP